ncbi:hypothetical protein ACJMK2_016514, partial [Sinanodonta woodiana]
SVLKEKNNPDKLNVICDECAERCLPLSNTGSNCSGWFAVSNCSVTCGNGTVTRVRLCTGSDCTVRADFDTIICNDTQECQEQSTQTNRQEDVKNDAQNFTSAHIAIAAIACFLLGILVATLVSIFYMKRKQQGCFFTNNKSFEVGSRMQSGPDLQTTRVIENEYESTDSKNETKTVETSYQSLDCDKISTDQEAYDHLAPELPFEHRDNKPSSGHKMLTLNNGNSANTTPFKIENVYEHERDNKGSENVSGQCKPNSKGQNVTHTKVEDMVREVCGENGNTDHVYSVLEQEDKTRNMLGIQSDEDHNYFVLETVHNVVEVGSG